MLKIFDVKPFIQTAEILLAADETIRALNVLNNLPAYYRDNEPIEVTDLRNEIMARLATPSFYATHSGCELTTSKDSMLNMQHTLRGALILEDVKRCNEVSAIPMIYDLGPGEYWLPILLKHHNLKFSYKPIYVNSPTFEHYKSQIEDVMNIETEGPKIFVACEIIEHLWNEAEIVHEMYRHCGLADVIHVSTPKYTFDTGCMDFRTKGDLGHLRAYTFMDFKRKIEDLFKDYGSVKQDVYDSHIFHARIVNPNTKYDLLKCHYTLQN